MQSPCCARAASDQLTAAPLKMVMNSRRLIRLPRGSRQAIVLAQTSTLKGGGYAFRRRSANVRFGSLADICTAIGHVRFTPESGHLQCTSACLLWADTVAKRFLVPEQRT